jgi:hypothetical protein
MGSFWIIGGEITLPCDGEFSCFIVSIFGAEAHPINIGKIVITITALKYRMMFARDTDAVFLLFRFMIEYSPVFLVSVWPGGN